jgi:hypothetical protein
MNIKEKISDSIETFRNSCEYEVLKMMLIYLVICFIAIAIYIGVMVWLTSNGIIIK